MTNSDAQATHAEPGVFGHLPITAGLIALVLVAAFGVAYWLVPSAREIITFAAAAAAAAGTIVGSFYSAAAIRQTSELHRLAAGEARSTAERAEKTQEAASHRAAEVTKAAAERAEKAQEAVANQARVTASLRMIERWNDPAFSETLLKWRAQRQQIKHESQEETWKRLQADLAGRAIVQDVLNRLEELATAALLEVADDRTLRSAFKATLDDVFKTCKPYIERVRQDETSAWDQIEKLHKRWW